MEPLTAAQIAIRFGVAGLTTAACLVVGTVLLWTTGVPETYPPLRPFRSCPAQSAGRSLRPLTTVLIRDARRLNSRTFRSPTWFCCGGLHINFYA